MFPRKSDYARNWDCGIARCEILNVEHHTSSQLDAKDRTKQHISNRRAAANTQEQPPPLHTHQARVQRMPTMKGPCQPMQRRPARWAQPWGAAVVSLAAMLVALVRTALGACRIGTWSADAGGVGVEV